MHESVSGVVLGILGFVGLTYLAVKIRQNQQRLRRTVGVIDGRYANEMEFLFSMVESGQLKEFVPEPIRV